MFSCNWVRYQTRADEMARELCAQQAGKSSGTRVLRQLVQFWQLSCAAHGDHRVPAVDKINDHIDKKADPLIQKIDALSERVARLEGPLTKRVSGLETRLNPAGVTRQTDRPQACSGDDKSGNPDSRNQREVAACFRFIRLQECGSGTPYVGLRILDDRGSTYQSKINQLSDEAPDPLKVSRPCLGMANSRNMASQGNVFAGGTYVGCVVDLDTQDVHEPHV
jgi:hypothetical protein